MFVYPPPLFLVGCHICIAGVREGEGENEKRSSPWGGGRKIIISRLGSTTRVIRVGVKAKKFLLRLRYPCYFFSSVTVVVAAAAAAAAAATVRFLPPNSTNLGSSRR